MFMSVWYAKKIGSRFLDNVRKTKKHRHRKMVGTTQPCFLLFIFFYNDLTSALFLIALAKILRGFRVLIVITVL